MANQIEETKNWAMKMWKPSGNTQEDSRPPHVGMESVEPLLDTYDVLSEESVVQKLNRLDKLVTDIACQMAQRWVPEEKRPPSDLPEVVSLPPEWASRLKEVTGARLYEHMERAAQFDLDKGLLLQFAWRACILSRVSTILARFSIASKSDESDASVQELSKVLFKHNDQPSYARWRTMTYKALKSDLTPEEHAHRVEKLRNECTELCYYAVVHVLKTDCPSRDVFVGSDEGKIEGLIVEAIKFADVVKESIASGEYVAYVPRPCDAFTAERMTSKDNEPASTNDLVCCTTQIGLEFKSKPRSETFSESLSLGAVGPVVLKKAEVVTEVYLQELLYPAPVPLWKSDDVAKPSTPKLDDADARTNDESQEHADSPKEAKDDPQQTTSIAGNSTAKRSKSWFSGTRQWLGGFVKLDSPY